MYDFKNVHFCVLDFMIGEPEERCVNKFLSRIKSKPKLIQPFLMEIRRAV